MPTRCGPRAFVPRSTTGPAPASVKLEAGAAENGGAGAGRADHENRSRYGLVGNFRVLFEQAYQPQAVFQRSQQIRLR
jgi:hypothetical protein